jgi:hypothetical protein
MYLHQQSRMDLSERSRAVDDFFNNLLTITVKCADIDSLYSKYKVDLFHQGMYLYDRFMFEMLVIAKTQSTKIALTYSQSSGSNTTPWMVSYLYSLAELLKADRSKTFFTKNVLIHVIWEMTNVFLTLSQVSLAQFQDVAKDLQVFEYLGAGIGLPQPESFDSAVVYLFASFLQCTTMVDVPAEPNKREQMKYDDTNLFDLKLQEFFLITFTSAKVELHEYFKNLQDNKFPKLLVVFNKLQRASCGNLNFYSRHFATNHDPNFRVSLAFILFEHREYLRCESVIKQILEKESPELHSKL